MAAAIETLTPRRARSLLPRIAEQIEANDERRAVLQRERLAAIRVLDADGAKQAEIASLARVTPGRIAQILIAARGE